MANKREILSLELFPYFQSFVDMFCEYKTYVGEIIETVKIDEIVYNLETVGIENVRDLLQLLKINCTTKPTTKIIRNILTDHYCFLAIDVVDIEELCKFLLFQFKDRLYEINQKKTEEKLNKPDNGHSLDNLETPAVLTLDKSKSNGHQCSKENRDKQIQDVCDGVMVEIEKLIERQNPREENHTKIKSKQTIDKIKIKCLETERSRNRKKRKCNKNKKYKDIKPTENEEHIVLSEASAQLTNSIDKNKYIMEKKTNENIKGIKLNHISNNEGILQEDKGNTNQNKLLDDLGTVYSIYNGTFGVIKSKRKFIIFNDTQFTKFKEGDKVRFDAVEIHQTFSDSLKHYVFHFKEDFKYWATNLWTNNPPEKRIIKTVSVMEDIYIQILAFLTSSQMNICCTKSEVFVAEENASSKDVSRCSHFQEPIFCNPSDGDLIRLELTQKRAECKVCCKCKLLPFNKIAIDNVCEAELVDKCRDTKCFQMHTIIIHMNLPHCKLFLQNKCVNIERCDKPHLSSHFVKVLASQKLEDLGEYCGMCTYSQPLLKDESMYLFPPSKTSPPSLDYIVSKNLILEQNAKQEFKKSVVCWYFQNGGCQFGNQCRNSHQGPKAPSKVEFKPIDIQNTTEIEVTNYLFETETIMKDEIVLSECDIIENKEKQKNLNNENKTKKNIEEPVIIENDKVFSNKMEQSNHYVYEKKVSIKEQNIEDTKKIKPKILQQIKDDKTPTAKNIKHYSKTFEEEILFVEEIKNIVECTENNETEEKTVKVNKHQICHCSGLIQSLFKNCVGVIESAYGLILFDYRSMGTKIGDPVKFDAIEIQKHFSNTVKQQFSVTVSCEIKFWATNVWTAYPPKERIIKSLKALEELYVQILELISVPNAKNVTCNKYEIFVTKENTSTDISMCSHFPEPLFCRPNTICTKVSSTFYQKYNWEFCFDFVNDGVCYNEVCYQQIQHLPLQIVIEHVKHELAKKREKCRICCKNKCKLLQFKRINKIKICKDGLEGKCEDKHSCIQEHMNLPHCRLFLQQTCFDKLGCNNPHFSQNIVNILAKLKLQELGKYCSICTNTPSQRVGKKIPTLLTIKPSPSTDVNTKVSNKQGDKLQFNKQPKGRKRKFVILEDSSQTEKKRPVCQFYLSGDCKFDDSCRNSHEGWTNEYLMNL